MKKILGLACALALATAHAEQIVVSNYAVTTNGMPFAVAMEKGYFKEFKVDVDGILTSDGGGTTVRLPRQLAYPAAMEFLLTAEAFPASRALELGLLNEIVDGAELQDRALSWAGRIVL